MLKILTLAAFISAQISAPLLVQAKDPAEPERIISEFEESARSAEEELASEKRAKEKEELEDKLKKQLRDKTLVLAARAEELETIAENVPDVSEDVIERALDDIGVVEIDDDSEDVFQLAAVTAVASAIVYSITKVDMAAKISAITPDAPVYYDPENPVVTDKNTVAKGVDSAKATVAKGVDKVYNSKLVAKSADGLRNLYGNRAVSRGALGVGVLATVVAAAALADMTMTDQDEATVKALENTYLSRLVSDGQSEHLTEEEIEDAFEEYANDPEFRQAILEEVRVIVEQTRALNNEIEAQKEKIAQY